MFWIPILVLGSAAGAAYWRGKRPKGMTPQRQKIYEAALRDLKDAGKLRKLADEYEAQGLTEQAEHLRKRASLRELSKEVKDARRETFKKAMASKNAEAVLAVAKAFEKEGADGAAAALRKYAEGLKTA